MGHLCRGCEGNTTVSNIPYLLRCFPTFPQNQPPFLTCQLFPPAPCVDFHAIVPPSLNLLHILKHIIHILSNLLRKYRISLLDKNVKNTASGRDTRRGRGLTTLLRFRIFLQHCLWRHLRIPYQSALVDCEKPLSVLAEDFQQGFDCDATGQW